MKKIIAAILLTLALACLFSCGDNDAENENNSGAADTLKGEDAAKCRKLAIPSTGVALGQLTFKF